MQTGTRQKLQICDTHFTNPLLIPQTFMVGTLKMYLLVRTLTPSFRTVILLSVRDTNCSMRGLISRVILETDTYLGEAQIGNVNVKLVRSVRECSSVVFEREAREFQ